MQGHPRGLRQVEASRRGLSQRSLGVACSLGFLLTFSQTSWLTWARLLSAQSHTWIHTCHEASLTHNEHAIHQDVLNAVGVPIGVFERRSIDNSVRIERHQVGVGANLDAALVPHRWYAGL